MARRKRNRKRVALPGAVASQVVLFLQERGVVLDVSPRYNVLCQAVMEYSRDHGLHYLAPRKRWERNLLILRFAAAVGIVAADVAPPSARERRKLGPKPKEVSKRRAEYLAHLASSRWRDFRMIIFRARGRRCERCSATPDDDIIDLHHKTYERVGHELPEDVELLCRKCHKLEHKRK